ncbi:MAG: ArsR family transcriptional regulator [Saprospiraceae bacterium]|nr:ArsR family transcriptional regulator [Saprospiraceae bacterium]
MELEEAKQKFIQAWGTFGSNWGINRTMAQVHALLLISSEPLCADDIMATLKISRGNANMNIRALIDWGLVYKELKPGERREYFIGEKDMWKVVRQIIVHRKKKELEPVLKILEELKDIEGKEEENEEFVKVIKDIQLFSEKADRVLDKFIRSDSSWLMNAFLKMI